MELSTNKWLEQVAQHHKEWVKIANIYKVDDYAEDIVQEVYIALFKYADAAKIIDAKGNVRKGYVFFTIKSLCFQYLNKRNKIDKIGIDTLFNLSDNSNIEEHKAYNDICLMIDEEIDNWHWYDKKLFRLYRDTDMSMRDIAKETNISLISIFHSIKNYKEVLNNKFMKDYQDYINNDYNNIY
jgi:DNA-directed RNA polymerase specialized sigma24 family protein